MTQKKSVQGRKWVEAGERNALLVAVRFSHRDKWRANYWLFQCDCGEETFQRPDYVKRGRVVSCGCYREDQSSERMSRIATTHGHSSDGKLTGEYNSWRNMRDRCKYPSSDNWAMYGGRASRSANGGTPASRTSLQTWGPSRRRSIQSGARTRMETMSRATAGGSQSHNKTETDEIIVWSFLAAENLQ